MAHMRVVLTLNHSCLTWPRHLLVKKNPAILSKEELGTPKYSWPDPLGCPSSTSYACAM